ncbi:MAG: nucleotidyltransferase family protein [Paludibacteraceae bacterium]|nr:nucleotidyltransferase family protein [Paludibacteraceae bacterium]
METSRAQFLELIKAALWRRSADDSMFRKDVDWARIFKFSQEQAVIGVAYEGIMTLPENLRPDKILFLRWYGLTVKIENIYHKHIEVLSKVYSFFGELGIRPVLMKGLGVASLYPKPERRQSGDIDLYVSQLYDFPDFLDTLTQKGIKKDAVCEATFKHVTYHLDGVELEIHKKIARMLNPFYERSLRKMTQEATQHFREVEIGGVKSTLLPVQFDAIFLLIHIITHFAEGGIGLRQLSDWTLFCSKHAEELKEELFVKKIKKLGLIDDWKLYTFFCIKYLGLNQEKTILYDPSFEKRADRLAEIVFDFGNFGKYTDEWNNCPHSYVARKLYALRVHWRYFVRTYKVAPKDAVCNLLFIYSRSAWDRMKHRK